MLNVGVYDMSQFHSPLPLLCDSTKLVTPSIVAVRRCFQEIYMVNTSFSHEGTEVESPRKFPAPPKNFKTGKRFGVNLTQDG